MFYRMIVAATISLFMCGSSFGTYVSGEVWGEWGPAGNPYEVIGDLIIPDDSTLIVDPGVDIIFNGHYEFRVNAGAVLSAIGTAIDSIIFTAADTSIGWNGICFGDSTGVGNEISYCRLEYGKATTEDRRSGGAIWMVRTTTPIIISHNTFYKNIARNHGGAIHGGITDSVKICHNHFWDNRVTYDHGQGGAVFLYGSQYVEISHNCFYENHSSHENGKGGAICLTIKTISLMQFNLFSYNSAAYGGAIYVMDYLDQSDSRIIGNTINNNEAIYVGGGIFLNQGNLKVVTNNILWDNSAIFYPQLCIQENETEAEISYNNIEGGYPYSDIGNINEDPCFAYNPYIFSKELAANSPCINTGSPWLPQDPDSTRSDMGAFYCDKFRWISGEWNIDNSPYYLRQDAEIPAESTLVIDPGVEIYFTNPCIFEAGENSTLQANGTSEYPIVFNCVNPDEGWKGVRFDGSSSNSYLNHCIITNANYIHPSPGMSSRGITNVGSDPTISNCHIYNNGNIYSPGGAIGCYMGSDPVLERNIIHHNTGSIGGAIFVNISSPSGINNTIVQNYADSVGGGIVISHNSDRTVDFRNTIIYSNSSLDDNEISIVGSGTVSASYCDIRGGWEGVGNIDADPLLVGGDPYDCNLTELSPCIDMGDPSSPNDPDDSRADIGALPHYHISNIIYGEWGSDNSPYLINIDTRIPPGSTLVIDAGVEVLFEGHYQFIVDSSATLQVNGAPYDSVLFTAIDTTEGWGGIRFMNSSQDSRLEHCIIEYGFADGDTITDESGGAVYCYNSDPAILNCMIRSNRALRNGGAIASFGSSRPIIERCLIIGNQAQHYGGALYTESSNITLINNTIVDNSAGLLGDGLLVNNCSTSVSNSIIWSNDDSPIHIFDDAIVTATYNDIEGGWTGEGNIDADPLFRAGEPYSYKLTASSPCIDAGDPTSPFDPDGSIADMGIFHYHHTYSFVYGHWTIGDSPYYIEHDIGVPPGTSLLIDPGVDVIFNGHHKFIIDSSAVLQALGTLEDSIVFIAADTDEGWHGLRFNYADSSSHLSYCRIQYGKATGEGSDGNGGGIQCSNSPITISNCDISSNFASSLGGGIFCINSDVSIRSALIYNNQSSQYGGGISLYWSDAELYNNTITNNDAPTGGGIQTFSSGPSITNCIIWGNDDENFRFLYDQPIVTYCDIANGYPGEGNIGEDPIFANPNNNDFNLLWDSPCIDAGDPGWIYDSDNTMADIGALPFYHSGTEVSGEIWGQWDSRNHPYYVTGDINVPLDSTLIIDEGILVYFNDRYSLIVDSAATIQANGSTARPVTFTAPDTSIGWFGIGFFDVDSTSILNYCVIENVKTDGHDHYAPVYMNNSSPVITNCIIKNNLQHWGVGGGIKCNNYSNPLIQYCMITNNRASYGGGGIACRSHSSPKILDCEITNNNAAGGTAQGGGIYGITYCSPIIRGCLISENRASRGAGIFLSVYSSATIEKTALSYNIGPYGTAMYCRSNSNPEITNCSITGHHGYRGAIYCEFGADPIIMNSILWDNTPAQIYLRQAGDGEPCSLSVGYTDLENGIDGIDIVGDNYVTWGEGNVDTNPRFFDPYLCYFEEGSPCIDAGNPHLSYNDPEDPDSPGYALWPAMGTLRNDMGAYGGFYDEITGIIEYDIRSIPQAYAVFQNYPNPFNAYTTIRYNLPKMSDVRIVIYNILGQQVEVLTQDRQMAGYQSVIWKANDVASGMYFFKLQAGSYIETKKMLLLK